MGGEGFPSGNWTIGTCSRGSRLLPPRNLDRWIDSCIFNYFLKVTSVKVLFHNYDGERMTCSGINSNMQVTGITGTGSMGCMLARMFLENGAIRKSAGR
jgi:hypothetical protein